MGTQITIDVIFGTSDVEQDDLDRAETAALAVIAASGSTVDQVRAEFVRQWAWLETDDAEEFGRCQDYKDLDGLALVWVKADVAANDALTEGWHNRARAMCAIAADPAPIAATHNPDEGVGL